MGKLCSVRFPHIAHADLPIKFPPPNPRKPDMKVSSTLDRSLATDATTRLLALLADGAERTLPALAVTAGMQIMEVKDGLQRLANAGFSLSDRDSTRFCLDTPFEPINEARILEILERANCAVAVQATAFLDSTNAALLRAARQSQLSSTPHALVAEVQTHGRGRLGKPWITSPGKALTFSLASMLPLGIDKLSGISLVCGLALRTALMRENFQSMLKWPNDILFRGHKLAGILVEAHAINSRSCVVVIGIGLNVRRDPRLATHIAGPSLAPTSLEDMLEDRFSGIPFAPAHLNRDRLLAGILIALCQHLSEFASQGFAPFVEYWNLAHAWAGRRLTWTDASNKSVSGVALAVDASGHLLVEVNGKTERILNGEISLLRPS